VRVAFRADASLDIGSGHVMRCLSLAEGLRARGAECVFLARKHQGHLNALVQARGYEARSLGGADAPVTTTRGDAALDYSRWLGVDARQDAEDTLAQIRSSPVDWLVVDHYSLDAEWERGVMSACTKLLAIDDLANRPHQCDALLDQNLGKSQDDYDGLTPDSCIRLIGPGFALLRAEFAKLRPESLARRVHGGCRRLLVSMGGVDRDDTTSEILDALKHCDLPEDSRVTVVMGPNAPWRDRVKSLAEDMPFSTPVLANVSNMAELMRDADLAIGAAGTTSWERCCLGLPTIQLVLADNQRSIAEALSDAGAAFLVKRAGLAIGVRSFLTKVSKCDDLLLKMSRAAAQVTDGNGVGRVVSHLFGGLQK